MLGLKSIDNFIPTKFKLYATKSVSLDAHLKDISHDMLLVTHKSNFEDQIISHKLP